MTYTAGREVTLQLGAESYVLVLSFAAICGIEEAIGTNLFQFGRRLEAAQVSAAEFIDFAHACLTGAGHEVTRERLAELIVEAGTSTVLAPLTEYCRIYIFGARKESELADTETGKPATSDTNPDAE